MNTQTQTNPHRKRAASLAEPVNASRGAPMGRGDYTLTADGSRGLYASVNESDARELAALRAEPRRFRLELQKLDSGGYDRGGAYWGHMRGCPLYFALSDDGRVFRAFRNSKIKTRADALAALREEFPKSYTHTEKRERTRVVFRVWRDTGDVIALFPDEAATHHESARISCGSYMHVGQHSAADYSHVMRATRPATAEESAPLARELEAAPYFYDLRIVRHR